MFLQACPNLENDPHPFADNNGLREVRNTIVSVDGRSRLIALYRLIEWLGYFLFADQDWTEARLIPPLVADTDEAVLLWRALARRRIARGFIQKLGLVVVERALDLRLDRETRTGLSRALVLEVMWSLDDATPPAIPTPPLTQMLRSLEDEVRASVADTVQKYLAHNGKTDTDAPEKDRPEAVFDRVIDPFLRSVWPQERSLATPGVSKAFADLPAVAGTRFAAALELVQRFLVPFDSWSLFDYGLYGTDLNGPRFPIIDDETKALAFLTLLDRTIGNAENAVVPHDIGSALDHIRRIAPKLEVFPAFRRLATAARRN